MENSGSSVSRSKLAKPHPEHRVEFGQEDVAQFITGEIEEDPDVHIAINGPWGSGKTTVLEQVRENFDEKNSSFITAWFDPWRYSPDQTTLRRTFLKKITNEASNQSDGIKPFDEKRFHFSRTSQNSRSFGEIFRELSAALFRDFKLAAALLLLIAGLTGIRLLIDVFLPNLLGLALGTLSQILIYVVLVSSILYFRDSMIELLGDVTTYEIKEPKISEIDLFEKEYNKLLGELEKGEKNLVILIDDIDRCNTEEIREVTVALSTYLDPDDSGAPVSIVAAIDGQKVVDAFHTSENDPEGYEMPNILHKTFQFVVPTPSLSRENVFEMVSVTAEDLDYNLSQEDKEHITSISVSHGASNPRIIRSALSNMVWIEEYGKGVLQKEPLEDSKSLEDLLNDDSALFRVSLIKMLSEQRDLRKFVTDATMWLNPDRRDGSVEWDIFDYTPKFEPGSLDPRPLLALNLPNEYVSDTNNYNDIKSEAENWNQSELAEATRHYAPATKVDLAYRLLDTDFDDMNQNQKANFVNSIVYLAHTGLDAINANRSDLLEDCTDMLRKDGGMVNQIHRNEYTKWFELAEKMGKEAIDDLVSQQSPFYKHEKQHFLRALSDESSNRSIRMLENATQLEIIEVKQHQPKPSANRSKKIFTTNKISKVENAPEYLLEVLENWAFESNPEGPPESLLQTDVVDKLAKNEYRERAINVFKKVGGSGSEGEDYLKVLIENTWPTPQDYPARDAGDQDSEGED